MKQIGFLLLAKPAALDASRGGPAEAISRSSAFAGLVIDRTINFFRIEFGKTLLEKYDPHFHGVLTSYSGHCEGSTMSAEATDLWPYFAEISLFSSVSTFLTPLNMRFSLTCDALGRVLAVEMAGANGK